MPEELQGEMPANEPADEMPASQPLSVELLQAELNQTRDALKKANASDAKRRKALEAMEAEKQAKADAELTEMERLKKQLDELNATNTALQLGALKRQIAAEVGLPDALAARLQGDDADAIKADAEALLATLPKAAPTAPSIPVTNPGSAAKVVKDSDQVRLARIMGARVNAFDPYVASQHGGGVVNE